MYYNKASSSYPNFVVSSASVSLAHKFKGE